MSSCRPGSLASRASAVNPRPKPRGSHAQVSGHGEDIAGILVGGSDGEDLTVGLDHDKAERVVHGAEVGDDLSCRAEGGVERAMGAVAGDGKIVLTRGFDGASDEDLDLTADGLEGDAARAVVGGAEVGDDLARGAEAGVERAVRIVAGQGEVRARAVTGVAGPA